jgi:hypothetical protein
MVHVRNRASGPSSDEGISTLTVREWLTDDAAMGNQVSPIIVPETCQHHASKANASQTLD